MFPLNTRFFNLLLLSCLLYFSIVAAESHAPSKFHIVTCASRETKELQQLITSAQFHGMEVEVLGIGIPYAGNSRKFRSYLEYLDTVPENDIILFVDAYDVLILADEKTILETFHQMNAPFVISVETYCWPPELAKRYLSSPTLFKYINSGVYIGYAGYMKNLFKDLPVFYDYQSDQGVIARHYFLHRDAYRLDYHNEISLCLFDVDEFSIILDKSTKKGFFKLANKYPCIFHWNGPAKSRVKSFYQECYNYLF